MIRHLLTATIICAAAILPAQQLNNSGFENWTSGNPDNWGSFDQMLGMGTTLESQVSPGNSGASACQLKTQNVQFVGLLPGVIASGSITLVGSAPVVKGTPYTAMPTDYTFYYKFTPGGVDTAGTEAIFTKWNTSTNSRDTVGYGVAVFDTQASSFTLASVPIFWFGLGAPDSAAIIFVSSATASLQANTTFIVDDVTMIFPTGIKESFVTGYNVYPNPSTDRVTINSNDDKAVKAHVYDLTGREVTNEDFISNKASLNVSTLPEGLYIYRVMDANGSELKNGKITVAR